MNNEFDRHPRFAPTEELGADASSGARRRSLKVVEISGILASADPNDLLVTYSLGSCVGLAVYDPVERIGGMSHSMLPLSKDNKDRSLTSPGMFTDIAVVELLNAVLRLGARKDRLVAKVAGGGSPLTGMSANIGERNIVVVRKILWKNNIIISGADLGGAKPKTLRLYMDTGRVTVNVGRTEKEL